MTSVRRPRGRSVAVLAARVGRCGGAAGRMAPPGPRRTMRGPSSSSASSFGRAPGVCAPRPRSRLRRSASWRPRRPCAWSLRRACGALLPRACALRRLRARPSRWPRAAARILASSSAILRSSASRRRASPSAWARRLRSSSVSVRSTTPDAFGAGAAGAGAAAGAAAAWPPARRARRAWRPAPPARRRRRRAPRACRRRRAVRRFLTSTTTCLLRPWLKLWRTTPVSVRGLSDSVDFCRRSASCRQGSWSQPFRSRILSVPLRPRPLSPGLAGPKALQARKTRQKRVTRRPGKQGCMYHI